MTLTHRFARDAARAFRLGAVCVFLPIALFSACDRVENQTDGHSSDGHSHAPGQGHASPSPAKTETANYTCPMHPEVQQATPGKCPKCGMDLVQKSAANGAMDEHAGHGEAGGHDHGTTQATISVAASTAQPLTAGQKTDVTLVLKKQDGSPVTLDNLKEAHTEKIHVLIIDPTLTDYHHEHPVAGDKPGEYRFSFTPQTGGPYRLWADLVPADTGKQEYAIADLGGTFANGEIPARAQNLTATVEGLTYAVSFEGPLNAGKAVLGTLTVKGADGAIFSGLEPIMGAYAHLVGFSEDRKTIAHIHPMGEEPTTPADRGAGELKFHIQPEQPGLLRLFAQVQIGGQSKFAMFTLEVSP